MGKLPKGTTCETLNSLAGQFRKVVDFYFWKGIACFRMWPRFRILSITPAQAASAAAFQSIAQMKRAINSLIRENYVALASGSTYTWSDLFTAMAMEYWKAAGELPPAVTSLVREEGSGIKTIHIVFDRPCSPRLFFFRKLRPVSMAKRFRGMKKNCKKPAWQLAEAGYPMELYYEHSYDMPLDYSDGRTRISNVNQGPSSCAQVLAAALAQYVGNPETPLPAQVADVGQEVGLEGHNWYGGVRGIRVDASWLPHVGSEWELVGDDSLQLKEVQTFGVEGLFENFGGQDVSPALVGKIDSWFEGPYADGIVSRAEGPFTVEDINGVLYHVVGYGSTPPPGGSFRCRFADSPVVEIPATPCDILASFSVDFKEGVLVRTTMFHPDYYAPPTYPVCAYFPGVTDIYFNLELWAQQYTVGPRWEYTFTFPRPLKKEVSIYCSFTLPDGTEAVMYPVYVWPGQMSADQWASVLLDPYWPED